MSMFSFKKDFEQIKKTWKDVERIIKKIEEGFPLLSSIMKSIFVIIKWLFIAGIIAGIILIIIAIIHYYVVESPYKVYQEEKAKEESMRKEEYQNCLNECKIEYPDAGLGLVLPGELPSIKRALLNNCLSDCEGKYKESALPQFKSFKLPQFKSFK